MRRFPLRAVRAIVAGPKSAARTPLSNIIALRQITGRFFSSSNVSFHGKYEDAYIKGILAEVRVIALVGASTNWVRRSQGWFEGMLSAVHVARR